MFDLTRPWLLALVPFLLAWWMWRFGKMTEAIPQFLPTGSDEQTTDEQARRGFPLPHPRTLRLMTLTILVLALTGPRTQRVQALDPEEGLALVVALDLSGSMGLGIPGGSSRLEVAIEEITRFVQSRRHDRIGLVTFSEEAITRVPPTTDHSHLLNVLQSLEQGSADEGTALGVGLGLAAHAPFNVPTPSRMVLLLTDGALEVPSPAQGWFGADRVLSVVRENRHRPAREIIDELLDAIHGFARDEPLLDDVTVVVVKVEASGR